MAYSHVYEIAPFQPWPTAMSMVLRPFRARIDVFPEKEKPQRGDIS
ncbi:hypothetical protein C943_04240 [Mariniradius saccharolyticus AK6]|uniref:Uncharacterized protein n=1 Tax=Mariniradius saccharolyticus AK6 TaxID=1239962 RepID=M7Y9T1_9BACT|nr:hypothetical protein C943_04240 [Mariniradius saccharolyticus AK6]